MKKSVVVLILVGLLAVSFIGCGKKNVDNTQNNNDTSQQASDIKKDVKKDLSTEVGEYVGQIDGNSIEVKIEGTPKAFRLGEAVREQFPSYNFKKGEIVKLHFWLNEYNQPVIEKIEKNS